MLFDDTYKTISKSAEGIFKDKGSKFIAYAFPIRKEDDLKERLNAIKSEHSKARHHCWAIRLGPDRSVFRFNDDGEPSGTAGRPILNCMLSADVTDLAIVVVRYFGGTLLGVPGLINAYKQSAQDALENAEIVEKTLNDTYVLRFDYIVMNEVMRVIKDEDLQILSNDYDTSCVLKLQIRKGLLNRVLEKFEKINGLSHEFIPASL